MCKKNDIQQIDRKIEIGLNDFINYLNYFCETGLVISNKNKNKGDYVTTKDIKHNLDLKTIHTLNYLKIENAIEIIFKNNSTSYLYGI